MQSRRSFLSTLAAAGTSAVLGQPSRKPNVIVIYTDDQGIGDLGCYGARDLKTPNMDRLASMGVRFTDWYSNSPVCSPSRASLLTGKYPQRVGITDVLTSDADFNVPGLPANGVTLPGELRKLGYRTSLIGKWHLGSAPGSRPRAQGFDEFFGFYSGWTDGFSHRYYRLGSNQPQIFHDMWHNEEEVWDDPENHTELFTRKATEYLRRQSQTSPFFLYLAYGAPHYPMIAPRKYVERFPATMDRDRRMHAAMLAMVDDGVGAVLDTLRERNLAKDTIVFFQSDNGATQESRADHRARPYRGGSNAPFRGYKMGLFEGGIRMPAIMCWPGRIPAGRVNSRLGAAMDIFPTLLSWADANDGVNDAVSGIDGRNVLAMITGDAPSPHDALFWGYHDQRAVRKGDWKLILNPPSFAGEPVSDKIWLSNLKDDPGEKRNWIGDQPSIARDLQARLDAWEKAVTLKA